jgi:thiol-disulfide isomerase/thioredoxin
VIALTIYTRPGCHLCDEMKATINRVSRSWRLPVVIEEIDISSDPELETRYGQEIPVLLIEGRKAAKYRVTEEELARILKSQLSRGS